MDRCNLNNVIQTANGNNYFNINHRTHLMTKSHLPWWATDRGLPALQRSGFESHSDLNSFSGLSWEEFEQGTTWSKLLSHAASSKILFHCPPFLMLCNVVNFVKYLALPTLLSLGDYYWRRDGIRQNYSDSTVSSWSSMYQAFILDLVWWYSCLKGMTWKSNHLLMLLQRQHFLLSYFKTNWATGARWLGLVC